MAFLTAFVVLGLVWVLGSVLVRMLGWPTDMHRIGKWVFALLVIAIVFSLLPGALTRGLTSLGPMPQVPLDEIVPVLLAIGLAVLGGYAWSRGADEREKRRKGEDATRFVERRRVTPPPPSAEHAGHLFLPVGQPRDEADPPPPEGG